MEVNGGAETHSQGSCSPSDKGRESMDIKEEIISANPRYTHMYMSDQRNKRRRVDHTDPFAVRDYVQSFDSPKYGSVTKDIEDLLARNKQMMTPIFRQFPALAGANYDSMDLKHEKRFSSADNYKKHDDQPNAYQLVVVIDSDDDEATSPIPLTSYEDTVLKIPSKPYEDTLLKTPSKPYQDSVLNKPTDQSIEQILEGNYALEQAPTGGKDTVTAVKSRVTRGKSLDVLCSKNDVAIEKQHDDMENKKQHDDMENKKQHDDMDTGNNYDDIDTDAITLETHANKPRVLYVYSRRKKNDDMDTKKNHDDVDTEKSHDDMDSKKKHDYMESKKKHHDMASKKKHDDMDTEMNHDDMDMSKKYHNDMGSKKKHDEMDSRKKHDDVDIEKKHDDMDSKKKHDDMDTKKKHDDMENIMQHDDVDTQKKHHKGEYVGVEDDDLESEVDFDGLGSIWEEMSIGLESSMDIVSPFHENASEDCDHTFILKEDIGSVCRVCGIIEKSIESIIEYQRPKTWKSTRTYYSEAKTNKDDGSEPVLNGTKSPGNDFTVLEVTADPTHKKKMKPHQIEGFNFLLSNLVCDNPGGCILAHAPGSGKTFMMISFIQSFMAKYPDARALVILPKTLLETWKKEFTTWKVEIPLLDLYSVKAEGRTQQYQVLKKWADQTSILFLGYQQFSSIVCDDDTSSVSVDCREILLKVPSIVILDEGHTPRNKNTNLFASIKKIQTQRKVVLSGTLYHNKVKEVFNILNLVRPKFLQTVDSKVIKRRILSRVPIESRKNFFEVVEHTLQKDEDFNRKVMVIEDLREMTSKVLHYYKGDSLDELPGLVDFSVFLNLTPKQKSQVKELKKLTQKFKVKSDGSAIYVHPALKSILNTDTKIDEQVFENLDENEGVKAKFYLNLLNLCESGGEKLLVFGQYKLPLKFLLKLTEKVKGWKLGKHMFMITGENDDDERRTAIEKFNNSPDSKVFFASIKTCGEGISLVGASRIIILDIHLNPSVTRQAIGRAFRPGQIRKVYTYRLIAADSPEAEDHETCFKKESISKMWFEWNEYCGHHDFEMEMTSVEDCGDRFLETPWLNQDVTAVYKRSYLV